MPLAIAIVGVPMLFVVLGQMAYGVSRRIGGFFPSGSFWIGLVGVCVIGGIIALSLQRRWSRVTRTLAAAVYAVAMGGGLLLLQGVVSQWRLLLNEHAV